MILLLQAADTVGKGHFIVCTLWYNSQYDSVKIDDKIVYMTW